MAEAPTLTTLSGSVHVQLFPAQIAEIVRGPNGPGFRHTIVLGEQVKTEMVRIAPRKTGNLASHIVKRIVAEGAGAAVLVGIEGVPYAEFVVKGTPPHQILPKKPGGMLVFFWPRVGDTVFFRSVQHPGTKPNNFMIRSLETVIR